MPKEGAFHSLRPCVIASLRFSDLTQCHRDARLRWIRLRFSTYARGLPVATTETTKSICNKLFIGCKQRVKRRGKPQREKTPLPSDAKNRTGSNDQVSRERSRSPEPLTEMRGTRIPNTPTREMGGRLGKEKPQTRNRGSGRNGSVPSMRAQTAVIMR
jgi:hypothetical protein